MAFQPSAVSDEPLIPQSQAVEPENQKAEDTAALRGDISCKGFWKNSSKAIFDVRICHVDAPSYRGRDIKKVFLDAEKSKRAKYHQRCKEARMIFSPLVFSADGMFAPESITVTKRLAGQLSSKWGRAYSEMCGFVRSRISIALVRSVHESLRGPRYTPRRNPIPQLEDGSGVSLYQ